MTPEYAPVMPMQMAPQFVPPQPSWPPSVPASRPPVASAAPAPVFRGAMPDDVKPMLPRPRPEPIRLTMPSPEELGLARQKETTSPQSPAVEEKPDWATFHRRLDALGARSFQLDHVASGWQCSCLLPTNQPNRMHRVESTAATEAGAVRLILDQVDQWVAAR